VNTFTDGGGERVELLQVDHAIEERQRERTRERRSARDPVAAEAALAEVATVAQTEANLLPAMREALRSGSTVGEICGVLRELWGTYDAQHA